MPKIKEVHFFDLNFNKGIKWYSMFFSEAHDKKTIGEASPFYMYLDYVPQRIYKLLPDVKLIFVIRHPVDRAYSHYWHEVAIGYEYLTFEKAIEKEPERLKTKDMFNIRHYSYLDRGIYINQLRRFYKFFKKEQILVLTYKELKENTLEVLYKISRFLGINAQFWDTLEEAELKRRYNVGKSPRIWFLHKLGVKLALKMKLHSRTLERIIRYGLKKFNTKVGYPPMKEDTRRKLLRFFEPYNRELEKFLGMSLEWWYY